MEPIVSPRGRLSRFKWLAMAAALGAVGLARPALAEDPPLKNIRVALAWLRNGQYGALYLADTQGFFASEGLHVTFLDGGPGKNPVPLVAVGQADFGVTRAPDIFTSRLASPPLDIVAIGAMGQKDPVVFLTLANPADPPPTPKDMEGKVVGMQPGTDFILKALAEKSGANFSLMKPFVVGAGAEPLLIGRVDYYTAFMTNQVYQVEQELHKTPPLPNLKGKVVRYVSNEQYGIPLYSDVLFTRRATIHDNPDLVTRFMRAAAKGVQFMAARPTDAAKIVATYPNEIEDVEKLDWRFKLQSELAVSEDTQSHGLLWMSAEKWNAAMELYRTSGQIARAPDANEVMTNAFNPRLLSDTH